MQTRISNRLRSLDLLGPAGGALGGGLLAFLFALLACIFRAPGHLHQVLLTGTLSQAALAFYSTLQLLGIVRVRPASDVQGLHLSR